MSINTQVPQERWGDFFVTLSNGNRGRTLSLEVLDPVSGDSGLARQGKLMAVDYDTVEKGNDIVVTTGVDEIEYAHRIETPVEVWKMQKDDGELSALEIIDQNNIKTILTFG